jgi:hypothetical protein
MTRRTRWKIIVCFVLSLVLGDLVLLQWKKVRISETTADLIRPGLTEAEVEALVGCPPGTYPSLLMRLTGAQLDTGVFAALKGGAVKQQRWLTPDGLLSVNYGASGLTVSARWSELIDKQAEFDAMRQPER